MPLQQAPQLRGVVLAGDIGHGHQLLVQLSVELVPLVQHVDDASGHARGEILAGLAQDDNHAPRHVLAAVVAHALHDGAGPGIADAEALARHAADIGLAPRRAVERHVADDDILPGIPPALLRGPHHQLAAGEALAEIVVGIAGQTDGHPLRQERAEGLPAPAQGLDDHGVIGQSAALPGNLRAQDRAEGAVHTGHVDPHRPGLAGFEGLLAGGQQRRHIGGFLQAEIVHRLRLEVDGPVGAALQDAVQNDGAQPRAGDILPPLQQAAPAHQLLHAPHAQSGHDAPELLGHEEHEVHHVFGLAPEAAAQVRVLGRHADGAGVQIAHPHHDAAHGDERRGGEAEFLRPQNRGDGHVPAGEELAVRLQNDPPTQAVFDEGPVGLGQPQLPGQAGVVDGVARGRARAAVVPGDEHHLGAGLGHAGGDGAHAGLRHELHGDAGVPVGVFQVKDELRQILDGVDIVVGRGADEAHAGGGIPGLRDPGIHLLPRQMPALAGLGALGHLDLDLFGRAQVLAGHAEPAGGHLLDGAVLLGVQPFGGLAALAGVGLAPQPVHGDRQALMGLAGDGAVGHGPGFEPAHDALGRLDLLQRDAAVRREVEVQEPPQGLGGAL